MSEGTHLISENVDMDEVEGAMWTNQIKSYNIDQVVSRLNLLESTWKMHDKSNRYIAYNMPFNNFFNSDELEEDNMPKQQAVNIDNLYVKYTHIRDALCELYHRAEVLNLVDESGESVKLIDKEDNDMKVSVRINRLIDQVDDAWQIIFRKARIYERVNNPTYVPINPESDPSIFRVSTIKDVNELSPYQQAILQTLHHLYEHNIKRYKGQCCTEIKTADGSSTRAWKPVQTIQEFVYSVSKKETFFELWKNLTSRGTAHRDVITHLTNCKDMQFPDIIKNRSVWSFNNGIFIGKEWSDKTGLYTPAFYTYDSPEFKALDQTIMSCKYFDQDFTDYSHVEDWYDIPTPHFQSILDYQGFEEDVCKWIYVLGGRLCFDVNEMDGWQVIPFLKGVARSGKSTLITKVFRKFYGTEDVRTLSNNVEKKFGLSSIYDAFMFIAPEVKNDLALEQAEFQSIVSGEDVSIAVKHEKAKSMEWKTPGILGGNEVPHWKDNSGSILRRILTVNFGKQVKDADPTLEVKLEKELPIILQKCIRGYLIYAQKYAEKDVWNVVPEYFKKVQKQVALVTSPLENFLQSHLVKFDENALCPMTVFQDVFNNFCATRHLGKKNVNYDTYIGPFSQRDIIVRQDSRLYNDKMYDAQEFIVGLDVIIPNDN